MDVVLSYRGRTLTVADLLSIQELIAAHPAASRRELSRRVCESWAWRQPNGQLCDMVCRSLMLALDRAGHLTLPARRRRPPNNVVARRPPPLRSVPRLPLRAALSEIRPLVIRQVRRTPEEGLFDSLLCEHHYLGYTRPVGEHLKYLVWAGERVVACLGWGSAPRHLGPRDRFIGWSASARRANLRYLAYNTRFLILPWVTVPHLASHLLGLVARRIGKDWQEVYGHPVYYLETFIDPQRFAGTCYRAANWVSLGLTTGRGNNAPTHRLTQPKKRVLGYPLTPCFRERLGGG